MHPKTASSDPVGECLVSVFGSSLVLSPLQGVFMNPSRSLPSMSAKPLDSSLLMRLPPETLDEIASYIDLHRDLVSLACASYACSKLVFPRHIQYRVIRVRFCTPLLWAHLARRADLSRNIREIHICDRQDYTSPDRYPTKLIDKQIDGAQHNFTIEEAMNNLCRALRNMKNLHTFTWTCLEEVSPLLPLHKPHLEDKFLAALRECPRLEHLALQGLFARFARINTYPLWFMSNLSSLTLKGCAWGKKTNAAGILQLLSRCPNLKHLDIPLEISTLAQAQLPALSHARLDLQSGVPLHIALNNTISDFLVNNPSITDLSWSPFSFDKFALPVGILSNIKRISTNNIMLSALDEGTKRDIEYLDIQFLDLAHMLSYAHFGMKDTLTTLSVGSFGEPDTLLAIPDHFPKLKRLYLPTAKTVIPLETWTSMFAKLPELEIFRGLGVWASVSFDNSRMHKVIGDLAGLCPNLTQIDHCMADDKTKDYKRIFIIREEVDGEKIVRYEVRRPRSSKPFVGIDRLFL
jgi:hypothetical protein